MKLSREGGVDGQERRVNVIEEEQHIGVSVWKNFAFRGRE